MTGGGSCSIKVHFNPAARGAQAATLSIPSDAASGSPTTISLQGNGLAPGDISVSPSFGDFGAVTDGQSSQAKNFIITNPGDNALDIARTSIAGTSAQEFSIVGGEDSCSNQSVSGGETCSVTVQFNPTARGEQDATLSIPSDAASGSPTTVSLAGDGLGSGEPFVDPSDENFGTVSLGQSAAHTVTLINAGDEPLSVGRVSMTGSVTFSIGTGQDTCSDQPLPAGETCTIEVQFAPTATGEESATLSIPTGSAGSATLVSLAGSGQSASSPVPTPKPTYSSPPVISGIATVGHTLSTSTGNWSGAPPISYSYQWVRCTSSCSMIAGATSGGYVLTSADLGAKMFLIVTGTNGAGSAQAVASAVGPVTDARPSSAHVKAALMKALKPSGKKARTEAIIKAGGYSFSFTAPSAGHLAIGWYASVNGHHVLVASATIVFHNAAAVMIKLSLTAKGRKFLATTMHHTLISKATFTPNGGPATSATKTFELHR